MDKLAVWGDLEGVEVRGITKEVDLGRVQQVGKNYVMTEKGAVSKERYFIPKYLVEGYDGRKLWFRVTEGQKIGFKREQAPNYDEYLVYRTQDAPADVETHVRIIRKVEF